MIFGDVLFIKLKNPLPHEIDFSQYAWPWREALQETYDESREVPAELESFSLSESDIRKLDADLGKWSVRKRQAYGQPGLLLDVEDATHFMMSIPQDVMAGGASVFGIDTCEACGIIVKDLNGFHVNSKRRELLFFGFQEMSSEPPEMGWSDDFGGATCGCV